MKTTLFLMGILTLAVSFFPLHAQGQGGGGGGRGGAGGGGAAAAPAAPAPRLANGRINLGPPEGQKGIWAPSGIIQLYVFPFSVNRASAASALPNNIRAEEVPFQPWAKALHDARELNIESDEPHTRCKASPGPREFITPYGVEFVDFPELRRMYLFDIGGPHTFRTIYMDGREHPKIFDPTYYGHSIGKWEGDTLVVDSVGFTERAWIDREGTPVTGQLHMTEKFTRTDMNTLKYEITIDDPGAYTAIWTGGFLLRWTSGGELFEYVCQDNNLSPSGMAGSGSAAAKANVITNIVP